MCCQMPQNYILLIRRTFISLLSLFVTFYLLKNGYGCCCHNSIWAHVCSSMLENEGIVQWDIIKDRMDLVCVCQAEIFSIPIPSFDY